MQLAEVVVNQELVIKQHKSNNSYISLSEANVTLPKTTSSKHSESVNSKTTKVVKSKTKKMDSKVIE